LNRSCPTLSSSSKSHVIGKVSIPVCLEEFRTQKRIEKWVTVDNFEINGEDAERPQIHVAFDYVAPSPTRILENGQTINDKFDVDLTIGTGQSVVKKAKSKKSLKDYAIKIISKRGAKNQRVPRSDIDREIEMMRTLSHPNIVPLYEVYESADNVYLVMELVKGADLFDVIQGLGALREKVAGAILAQILSALVYMHSRGIVHHDIKPENVIVDYLTNKVKLTDFGSARDVKTMTPSVAGTVNYMAPEIIRNMRGAENTCGTSVDIWSIGVVAYMMLSGANPFDNNKANNNIMNRIVNGTFDFPSPRWDSIPQHCKDFIKRCLVVDPKQRATAAELLKHPWISGCVSEKFTKGDQARLEEERNSRNSSRSNSVQQLMELFGNCPSRS